MSHRDLDGVPPPFGFREPPCVRASVRGLPSSTQAGAKLWRLGSIISLENRERGARKGRQVSYHRGTVSCRWSVCHPRALRLLKALLAGAQAPRSQMASPQQFAYKFHINSVGFHGHQGPSQLSNRRTECREEWKASESKSGRGPTL